MELLRQPDDIRLVYIGSAHQAIHYAAGNLPEPSPRADQILAVTTVEELGECVFPPWCHIGTELHTTRDPARTFPAVADHEVVFAAALMRRRRLEKGPA